MSDLGSLRRRIDEIDKQIVELLEKRAETVLEVKKAKVDNSISIYSPAREREIFERVRKLGEGRAFPADSLEHIFSLIVSATRSLVGELRIGYLATCYNAATKQFGKDVSFIPFASAQIALSHVEEDKLSHAVLPAETGLSSVDVNTFFALKDSNLTIVSEVEMASNVSLFSAADSLSDVDTVYGDATSFIRTGEWLKANLPRAKKIIEEDLIAAETSAAAQKKGALLSAAKEHAGLRLLAKDLADKGVARYIVVGKHAPDSTGRDRTSLICSVEDKAGALRDVLRPFAERHITLTRIESRHEGSYYFFIDLIGHQSEENIAGALKELSSITSSLKVLGSYPLAS